uniref:DUF4283 domain-containing protein n=1 Tax=Quercus lobata TaxID=97700 RepID=A0A7N2KXV8_QUELO
MEQAILDGLQNSQLTKEEEESIQISAYSRADLLEECHLSQFGKLLSNRQQNQRALKSTLRSAWKIGSDLRIVDVGNDILQFKFSSRYQMEWVEKNGPWNFANNLLLLCRWKKGMSAANIVFSHSPFWVQVWGVPFELMTEDTARDIGNRIGIFLEVDKRSWQADQAKYMRVRAELPLDKPLRRGGYLDGLGHDDRHCVAMEMRQVTEYQYGDWIRVAGGYKGGQNITKPGREERRPSSNESGRTNIPPATAEKARFEECDGSKKHEGGKAAKKQGSWEKEEASRPTRKSLNFKKLHNKDNTSKDGHLVVGFKARNGLEEPEVTSPVKSIIEVSAHEEEGYLDVGSKKNIKPKAEGNLKKLAREKGLVDVIMTGQERIVAPPRAMMALCWNCRGLGTPRSVGALHNLVQRWDPEVIFLMETKKKIAGMKKVKLKLGFVNGFYVQRQGRGGELAMFWRKEVNLEIKSYSKYHIDVVVTEEAFGFKWRITGFYGHPETH